VFFVSFKQNVTPYLILSCLPAALSPDPSRAFNPANFFMDYFDHPDLPDLIDLNLIPVRVLFIQQEALRYVRVSELLFIALPKTN
jgi:hypothetical protein